MNSKMPRASKITVETTLIPSATILPATTDAPFEASVAQEAEGSELIQAKSPTGSLDPETLQWMIAEAAYYKAERRDFEPGYEAEDWLAAEREILSSFTAQ